MPQCPSCPSRHVSQEDALVGMVECSRLGAALPGGAPATEVPLCKKEAPRSGPALGQEAGECLICERTLTSQGVSFRLKGSSMGTLAALCHGHCYLNAFLAFTYSDFCFPSGKEVSSVSLLPAQTGRRPYVHIRQLLSIPFLYPFFSYTTSFSPHQCVSAPVLLLLHFQYQALEYRNMPNQLNPDFNTGAFYGVVTCWHTEPLQPGGS